MEAIITKGPALESGKKITLLSVVVKSVKKDSYTIDGSFVENTSIVCESFHDDLTNLENHVILLRNTSPLLFRDSRTHKSTKQGDNNEEIKRFDLHSAGVCLLCR